MKLTLPFVWLVVATGLVEAFSPHAQRDASVHARHANQARKHVDVERRDTSLKKRCKPRASSTLVSASQTPSSSPKSAPPNQAAAKKPASTSSSAAPAKSSTSQSSASAASGAKGLITVVSSQCGKSGATEKITATSGPNGEESWLNCGIDGAGWNPPPVTINDVIAKDLTDAYNEPNSPFKACGPFIDLFNKYGQENGVPPIFIASIAMQESSCNPSEVGGAGEQGLMQITKDKCGGAPGGNCQDPDYNIRTGAAFYKSLLDSNDGNVLKATGEYNGWVVDLTIAKATAAANTACCRCQNNLDYLTQFLNGWVQGVDPSGSPRIGQYFNLDKCD